MRYSCWDLRADGHDDARQASEQGWDFVVACLDRLALLDTESSLRKQAEDALAQSAG